MRGPSPALPELLAPAGGPTALRAAIANGADAVYLGLERFNARRGAENFTLETLEEACDLAHLRGVRVYLTVNVIVLPHEIDDALELVARAWERGVDAVIVQDLGLLAAVRRDLPQVRLHASTQMNAHTVSTIDVLSGLGVQRVTLAREIRIEDIARLARRAHDLGMEVESFVHGALCVCHSGQCLLSSMVGGRSANRGMCAQPCRLPYELVGPEGRAIRTPGAHLLSTKDLAGILVLPRLIASGVDSLKIEGRMKSPEYVAIVTRVYREALERAASDPAFVPRDGEMGALSEAFSRGFSAAYLVGERGNAMMSYRRPNNRGVAAGRIIALEPGGMAAIRASTELSADDTIEVWTAKGRFAQPVGALLVDGVERRSVEAGTIARVRLAGDARVGDRLFRVRNASLMAAAERSYAGPDLAPVDVDVEVRVVLGEPVRVTVRTADGVTSTATGTVVEGARTRPVTAQDVIEHVGRFGGSGFAPRAFDVTVSPGAGIAYAELHRVRRRALDMLRERMLAPWRSRGTLTVQPVARPAAPSGRPRRAPSRVRLVASVLEPEAARACLEAGADEVHVPLQALGPADLVEGIVPVLPRICSDAEEEELLGRLAPGQPVVAGTIGQVARASARGALVQAHWSLNAANAESVRQLAALGAEFVWLSPELSQRQLAAVVSSAPVGVGSAVAGRQELMVTEHCVLMAAGPCAERCAECARRRGVHRLRDRKGYEFPVVSDRAGRSHIYNAVELDLVPFLDELLATGIAAARIDLETATRAQAARATRRVREELVAVLSGERGPRSGPRAGGERSRTTTGHFFRGVR